MDFQYRTIVVSRRSSFETSFEDKIDDAMVSLNKDGFEVFSVFPLAANNGISTQVVVIGKKEVV